MPTTPKLILPYPAAGDPADVPTDMNELATQLDTLAGSANGLATLGSDGKVPAGQLPAPSGGGGSADVAYSQRTTNMALTASYADTGLTVTFTADGTTAYWLEVFWPYMAAAAGGTVNLKMVVDGADAGVLSANSPAAGFGPTFARRRLAVLSAGSHTIKIQANSSGAGVGPLQAGDGSAATLVPAYLAIRR